VVCANDGNVAASFPIMVRVTLRREGRVMNLPSNVSRAIRDVQQRVKAAGGELHPTDPLNAAYFVTWLSEKNLLNDATIASSVIENILYSKVNEHYKQMVWKVQPPKLKRDNLLAAGITSTEKPLDRIALGKETDARTADEKDQQKATEKIDQMIDQFHPASRRPGTIDHKTKTEVQTLLRDHVAKEKARGVRMTELVPVVGDFIEKKYLEIERAISHL
jgi:hypothetical protein